MTDLISRRAVTFSGDIADSNYDSERYYVGGVDLEDEMLDLEKQVFPFAHNEDKEVLIKFQIKVSDESSLELGAGDFGIERYVGVAQANTALGQRRAARSADVDEISFTGRLFEGRAGVWWCLQVDGSEVNLLQEFKTFSTSILGMWHPKRVLCQVDMELSVHGEVPKAIVEFA